jgi:hypothetical protein
MFDCGLFEIRVEIGSASGCGLSIRHYLAVNGFSLPQLEQQTNSLSGDLGGRLP